MKRVEEVVGFKFEKYQGYLQHLLFSLGINHEMEV